MELPGAWESLEDPMKSLEGEERTLEWVSSCLQGLRCGVSHRAFTRALRIGSLRVPSRVWGKRCKEIKADLFRQLQLFF